MTFKLLHRRSLLHQRPLAIVEVNFIMDGIALEPNETVSLRFLPTVSVPVQEVLLDTIELTINDVDSKSSVHGVEKAAWH